MTVSGGGKVKRDKPALQKQRALSCILRMHRRFRTIWSVSGIFGFEMIYYTREQEGPMLKIAPLVQIWSSWLDNDMILFLRLWGGAGAACAFPA
jgi:hypothetical protein